MAKLFIRLVFSKHDESKDYMKGAVGTLGDYKPFSGTSGVYENGGWSSKYNIADKTVEVFSVIKHGHETVQKFNNDSEQHFVALRANDPEYEMLIFEALTEYPEYGRITEDMEMEFNDDDVAPLIYRLCDDIMLEVKRMYKK